MNPTAAPGMVLFHPGGFIITPLRSKMRYDKKITDFFSAGKNLTAKKSVLSVLYSPLVLLYHSKRELSNYCLPEGSELLDLRPSADNEISLLVAWIILAI